MRRSVGAWSLLILSGKTACQPCGKVCRTVRDAKKRFIGRMRDRGRWPHRYGLLLDLQTLPELLAIAGYRSRGLLEMSPWTAQADPAHALVRLHRISPPVQGSGRLWGAHARRRAGLGQRCRAAAGERLHYRPDRRCGSRYEALSFLERCRPQCSRRPASSPTEMATSPPGPAVDPGEVRRRT